MSKQQKGEKRKNKKALFAFVALFASAAIIIGSAFAFFSDYITGSGDVTAGTLNIQGTMSYKYNGVTSDGTINNFNPGDVVYVGTSITNDGNKSAWLQTILDLGTLDAGIIDYIEVCSGDLTYDACGDASNSYLTLSDGQFITRNANGDAYDDIINGTGAGAEIETANNGLTGPVVIGYTIKFLNTAPNSAQGQSVDFTFRVNAMQYRNNPSPSWTAIEQKI